MNNLQIDPFKDSGILNAIGTTDASSSMLNLGTLKTRKFYPMQVARRLHNKGFPSGVYGLAIAHYFMRKGVMVVSLPSPAEWRHIEQNPSLPILTCTFLK